MLPYASDTEMNAAPRHPFFRRRHAARLLVLGHRGTGEGLRENTLPAFREAVELGADIVETDLHVTRDGVPVLCHDPDIARTTNGRGLIAGLTLAELERFETHGPRSGTPSRIPTLAEALDALPDARWNIEIKDHHPEAAKRVLGFVEPHAERVLLTAGDDAIMNRLRQAIAEAGVGVAQGACQSDVMAFLRATRSGEGEIPEAPMALQIPEAFRGITLVDPDLVTFAHERGVEVHVWTVNEPDAIRRLRDLGVDGIVTDVPAVARGIADER